MEKGNIYANGQIYAIRSHQTDLIYIGSTTQPLHKRLCQHKSSNRYVNEILQYEDAYIELIEDFPCNSKKELNQREGQFIRNNNCINKRVAGRTTNEYDNEHKEQKKQYRINNKDKRSEQLKEYVLNHKEEIKNYQIEYRIKNKEKLKEQQRINHLKRKTSLNNEISNDNRVPL